MNKKWIEEQLVREIVPGCPAGGAEYVIYRRCPPKPQRRRVHQLATFVSVVCLLLLVFVLGAVLAIA